MLNSRSTYLLIILYIMLCPATSSQSHHQEKSHCSRKHSKFIREYFTRALLPIYQKYNLPVPVNCPFSPLHDIYHFHENNKTKLDMYKWKCEICGKHFLSENYLDKHFDFKHANSLQRNQKSICLANFCRIFRCDVFMRTSNTDNKCYDSSMHNLKKRCIKNLELCVPNRISLGVRNRLTAELRENLCSYLTCAKFNDPPEFMSGGPSFIKIFLMMLLIGFCIIAYGIINHTDLIFDETETMLSDDHGYNIKIPKNCSTKKSCFKDDKIQPKKNINSNLRYRVNFNSNVNE